MTRERTGSESEVRRQEARWQEDAPPSELGDVEDAVAEEVGGDLTEWAPPDEEDASEEATARDTKA